MKIIKRITVCLLVVLTFVQSPLVYAQELATPSATPVITSSPQSTPSATPSPFLDQLDATGNATGSVLVDIPVSSISAAMTTPTPTLEMLTGPSGVLSSSASIKGPPHIRPMTKHTLRAGEVASVVVENIDKAAVKATVQDGTGGAVDITPSVETYDGGIRVMFIPKTSMKPGKYTIVVEDATTGTSVTQDFLWGVLAFNTDQATYNPGDTAAISLAVLDEQGMMVCDADVTLTILSPTRKTTTLSTADGSIRVTQACSLHDFTLKPDYETTFQTSDEGVYQVLLSAITKNGTYSIQDSFQVSSDMPFGVKRVSATRIYPPKAYPMTIDVTANEDFNGTITETVPENFTITPLDGSVPYVDVKMIVPVAESQTPILLGMPFEGNYPVTLGFGDRIKDPQVKSLYEQNGLKGHDGADFAMPVGTQVLAADSGVVSRIADNPYGTTITIDHTWGRSYYGHLSVVQVKVGDTVEKGTPIAFSGNTGLTTGPHLHFGMKLTKNDMGNGYYGKIDPMPYLTSSVIYQAGGSGKQISWNVTVKNGETVRLGYTYKAPQVSPQFYLVGPLTFRAANAAVPAPTIKPDSPFVLGTATESAQPSDASASAEVTVNAPANSIVYQESRRWQIAADAAPNLPMLVPTVYSSTTGTAYTTTTVTNIDEDISSPDAAYIVAGANSTATIFYEMTDTPADFTRMKTLNYNVRYKLEGNVDDTEYLFIQIFMGNKTTPLTNKMAITFTSTNIAITNSGVLAFTGVSTTATKAEWDAAYVAILTTHLASKGSDGSVWSIDTVNITGTYDAPPTVSLTTPTDGATNQSTTPDLVFTGTDANSDEIEYNVQVDTVNTFDSQAETIDSYDPSSNGSAIDTGLSFTSGGTGYTSNIGQAFTGNGGYITEAKFYLKRTLNPTGTMTAYITGITGTYGTTAISNGSYLATSNNVNAADVPTGYTLITFTFATPFLTTNGAYYFVGVNSPTVNSVSFITVGEDTSSPTHSGNQSYYAGTGGWLNTATCDVLFYVLSTNPLLSKFSVTPDATFTDVTNGADTHPFASDDQIKYNLYDSTTDTGYFDGSDAAATDLDAYWTTAANIFDSDATPSTYASQGASKTGSTATGFALAEGTSLSSLTYSTISSVKVRMYAGGSGQSVGGITANAVVYTDGLTDNLGTVTATIAQDAVYQWSPYTTLSAPPGGWDLTKLQALEVKVYANTGPMQGVSVYKVEIAVQTSQQYILTANTTYYWRVAGIDPSGSNTWGAWSSIYSFTTAAGGGGGPTTDQQMRHGNWFSSGVEQSFTF